jgi:predicted nucleic acid-binding protein
MRYLIDSSLWIEYLDGSKLGEKVNEILSGGNEVYSLPIIISEVISRVKRGDSNVEVAYESIIKNSTIFDITPRIAKEAGILHAEMKKKFGSFPLADALIVCSAKSLGAKIITSDNHFKSFKEAIVL